MEPSFRDSLALLPLPSIDFKLSHQLSQAWIQHFVKHRLVQSLQLSPQPEPCAGVENRFSIGFSSRARKWIRARIHHRR